MDASIRRNAPRRPEQYQIADLLIDVGQQCVRRANVEVSLPKLSFDLLLALIRAAPNVVSNDELMAQVWPGVIVSPETISQRVKLLRDALGDDPHAPRYIGGLRGRGYRLIPPATAVFSRVTSRSKVMLAVVAGVAAIGVATLAVLVLLSKPAPQPERTVTMVGLPPRTVAVLPFENLSLDPANDFLALGVAEMVLNRLASVREIVVIARSSSFKFRDQALDAREIGRKLEARYLVEGGVQREADKLRVTARLIDAENGAQLAAPQFDGALADIFAIQEEIANRIAIALEGKLAGAAVSARGARSENLDAYLAYLRGRARIEKWTVADFEAAAKQFEEAIALDPQFAAAYVGLAQARLLAAWRRHEFTIIDGWEFPASPLMEDAASLIENALALDPSLSEGYNTRATLERDPARRQADYRRAIELDPSNSGALANLADELEEIDPAESRRLYDRAVVVDPFSASIRYRSGPRAPGVEAEEQQLLEVLNVDPGFASALTRLGRLRWMFHGDFAEGVKLAERAVATDPDTYWTRHAAYMMYVDLNDLTAARDLSDGPPRADESWRLLTYQYVGDWRAAGEAAYTGPSGNLNWNDGEAIRDLALHTGDYRRAIRYISRRLGEPRRLTDINIQWVVPLAHLLRMNAERVASDELLAELFAWMDHEGREKRNEWNRLNRVRANALALQGQREAALAELAAAFRAGDRRFWWYTIERDPLWSEMRSDPRFQAIASEARAHAAGQRALLEDMRRKGEVPLRPSKAK